MIFFRQGSHARSLTAVLAVTGEIPVKSLALFGSQRVYRALVTRLCEDQTLCNTDTGEKLSCRLLTLHGNGAKKSVRFHKSGLPVLDWVGARNYYLNAYWNHNFPSDDVHVERHFRFAEAAILFARAGAEIRPWCARVLQKQAILREPFSMPTLYAAKDLKKVQDFELRKTQYARFTGAVFTRDNTYVVYNARGAVMKWNGIGEYKSLQSIIGLSRMNTLVFSVDGAILFGKSEDLAVRTVEDMDNAPRPELRLDYVYRHVYFVPLNEDGIDQLRLLLIPNWNERLLCALFDPNQRAYNQGLFEYDAIVDGSFLFEFFDGDIARLIRFQKAAPAYRNRCELLCFPFQVGLVRRVLGDLVYIRTIETTAILDALGADRRTIFDGEI